MARFEWVDRLRFPLMLLVVFIHAYNPVKASNGQMATLQGWSDISDYILFTISQVFARASVPIFFALAGYFYFVNLPRSDLWKWLATLRKRVISLLVPFFIWGLFVVFIYGLAQFFGLRTGGEESQIGDILSLGFLGVVDLVVGFSSSSPIAYQFWFIRDLFMAGLISLPLIYFSNYVRWTIVVVLGVLWFVGVGATWIPSMVSIFFFFFGATCSQKDGGIDFSKVSKIIFYLYFGLSLVEYFVSGFWFYEFFHRLCLLLGCLSMYWISICFIYNKKIGDVFVKLSSTAFFLFAFHEPFLKLIKRLLYPLVFSSTSAVAIYFFTVGFVTVISIFIFYIFRNTIPRFLSIMVGGRVV